MRPSPRDVRRWFAQRDTTATVAAHLTMLHADPNWRVRYTHRVSLHTFNLRYSPTGACIEIVVLRVGRVCYPRLTTLRAPVGE